MNRQKFMSELEVLLRDISENDRMDAITYYNDYFDEAGKENEEVILRELGSPKKVADTIKEGLVRGEDSYGEGSTMEFSERGCFDRRSAEEWNAPTSIKATLESEDTQDRVSSGATSQDWKNQRTANRDREHQEKMNQKSKCQQPDSKMEISIISKGRNIPWFVIVLLLIFAAPVLVGVIAGIFGGLVGLIGGIFGVTVGTAGSGFGIFIGGLVCLVTGFVRMFSNPLEGLTSMGVGALLISIGILLLLLFVVLIRKWIPALVKGFVGGCQYVYRWAMGLLRRDEA